MLFMDTCTECRKFGSATPILQDCHTLTSNPLGKLILTRILTRLMTYVILVHLPNLTHHLIHAPEFHCQMAHHPHLLPSHQHQLVHSIMVYKINHNCDMYLSSVAYWTCDIPLYILGLNCLHKLEGLGHQDSLECLSVWSSKILIHPLTCCTSWYILILHVMSMPNCKCR